MGKGGDGGAEYLGRYLGRKWRGERRGTDGQKDRGKEVGDAVCGGYVKEKTGT